VTVRRLLVAALFALATSGVARTTNALFHFAVIDEVMTSYAGDANVQFVEVRMLVGLQNFVGDAVFAAFDTNADFIGDLLIVPADVANAGAGVRWIVGTTQFEAASGLTADFNFPAGILPTAGGMVCYGGGGGIAPATPVWDRTDFANYVDCVAYGTFAGTTNAVLTGLIGDSTPLDPDGHSVERISETDDNATDFACADPATPENNAGASVSMAATTACPAPPTGCPASVDAGCQAGFAKGLLLVKEAGAKSKVVAKMIKGPGLTQSNFGNPLSGAGTVYDLCLYGAAGTLVHASDGYQVDRAGDTNCEGKACWKAVGKDPPDGKGYKFKEKAGASHGVTKILLKGGAAGKSKILVKGKGAGLPSGVTGLLAGTTSATIQLRASDGVCVSVTVSDIKKAVPGFFKAK